MAASTPATARVAQAWRDATRELGLTLYPRREADSSPTVTALRLPAGLDWPTLDARLRTRGMVVGGNYGPLAARSSASATWAARPLTTSSRAARRR
jgi:aspartate aminotransferase-like enzyme